MTSEISSSRRSLTDWWEPHIHSVLSIFFHNKSNVVFLSTNSTVVIKIFGTDIASLSFIIRFGWSDRHFLYPFRELCYQTLFLTLEKYSTKITISWEFCDPKCGENDEKIKLGLLAIAFFMHSLIARHITPTQSDDGWVVQRCVKSWHLHRQSIHANASSSLVMISRIDNILLIQIHVYGHVSKYHLH